MVETKKVPNSLQVSLVSPQTPEQVLLRCYIDLNGKRKAWTERSPDIYDSVKHCVRSHTEYTRQPQSTDVKVCDNHTAQTLSSFGKETADQAIQQGNAREIAGHRVNRRTYSSVQHDGQQYITKYGTPQSLIVANQPSQTLSNTFGVLYPPGHLESEQQLLAWQFGFLQNDPAPSQLGSPQLHPSGCV
ncbi:hypothetical protein R3P38DRAFT_2768719 [Favolaschia claudopus]|uniref:Uncharacterized protein n=1 Tax=Favolaschia claudopus TaxID=2862362 RepID=A0AAW0CMW9_9AGAR